VSETPLAAHRRALAFFGIVALIAVGVSCAVTLYDGRDSLDRTRVLDVKPSPDGRRAAVVYLHRHANSGTTTVRAALADKPPFPATGHDFAAKHPLVAVRGTGGDDAQAKAALRVDWRPDGKLDLCAASDALVMFSADGASPDQAGAFVEDTRAAFRFCDAEPLAAK
jgi:hypothetical protein